MVALFCQNNEVMLKTLSIVSIALVIVSVLVSFVIKEPKGNKMPSHSLLFYWKVVSYGLVATAILDVFGRRIQSIFSLGPKYEIVFGLLFLFFITQFFLLQVIFLKRNIW